MRVLYDLNGRAKEVVSLRRRRFRRWNKAFWEVNYESALEQQGVQECGAKPVVRSSRGIEVGGVSRLQASRRRVEEAALLLVERGLRDSRVVSFLHVEECEDKAMYFKP